MTFKYKLIAAYARFVAKHRSHRASETCKLLVEAVQKKGYGQMPWHLKNVLREWARTSDNPIDRYVLAIEIEKDEIERLKGIVIYNITNDWAEPTVEMEMAKKDAFDNTLKYNTARGYGLNVAPEQKSDFADALLMAIRQSKGGVV